MYPCKFNCGVSYKLNGECKRKHESKCTFNDAAINIDHLDSLKSINHTRGRYSTKNIDHIDLVNNNNSKNNKFSCLFCQKTFVTEKTLGYHSNKYHNNDIDNPLLNDFNMTVYSANKETNDISFFNTGFAGTNNNLSKENQTFQSECCDFLNKYDKNFKIALININSVESKFQDIKFLLNKQLIDILIIVESKLCDKTDTSLFKSLHYDIIRRDRGVNKGGGILIFVKTNLNRTLVLLDADSSDELISFIIKFNNNFKLGIIACYRPPHPRNEASFIDAFNSASNDLDNQCDEIIAAGDFNYDFTPPIESSKFHDLCDAHGLKNTIKKPTRRCPITGNKTLLDLILCFTLSLFIDSNVFS